MIISSNRKLPINTIYTPEYFTDDNGNMITPQPLFILRETTKEEYEKQSDLHKGWRDRAYYYEISTD